MTVTGIFTEPGDNYYSGQTKSYYLYSSGLDKWSKRGKRADLWCHNSYLFIPGELIE